MTKAKAKRITLKSVAISILNNIILISASLIFVASIAISIYLNEPRSILGGIIVASLLTSAYIIVTEVAIRFARASLEPI